MAIPTVSYETFRKEVMNLLTADSNLLKEDEDMLQIISESEDPRAVLDLARAMKDEGNAFFKNGVVDDALEKYGYAALITTCYVFAEEYRKEFFDLTVSALLNSAACFSKMKEFEQAGLICSIILDFNPSQVKALYRRSMAVVELGRKDLAYWDLMKASKIDPKNKEIQLKLDQLRDYATRKEKENKQNCSVPIGLGMGVPELKKRKQEHQSNKSEMVGNLLVENEKVNVKCYDSETEGGIKDDKMAKEKVNVDERMQECVSGLSFENSNKNVEDMSSEGGLDTGMKRSPSSCASSVNEVRAEEEEVSSNLKNSNPAESIYRFANRRKADSFLSISDRDYHKLRIGRSVQYFNHSAGVFMSVRMIQPQKKKPIINKVSARTSKMDISTISNNEELQDKFEEQSMEEGSTVTHENKIEDQSLEEEVAENSRIDIPMEVNQLAMEINSDYAQQSSATCRVRSKPYIRRKTRKKIAQPHTLYGAGKRAAKKRVVQASSSNLSFCRFQHTRGKKRAATSRPDVYEGIRKKFIKSECQSAASNVLRYVGNRSKLETCIVLESNGRSEPLPTHEMVSPYSSGW